MTILFDILAIAVGVIVLVIIAFGCIVVALVLTWLLICAFEKTVWWFKKNFRMW